MSDKRKKTLDEMIDEIIDEHGTSWGAVGLDETAKKQRDSDILKRLAAVREEVGSDGTREAAQMVQELAPKVRMVSPRVLGSNESVESVDLREREKYELLRKLLNLPRP